MKWIKTSDRLPKESGWYLGRNGDNIITNENIPVFITLQRLIADQSGKTYNNIEWLDESEPLWFIKPEITDTDRMNWLNNNLHIDTINDLGNFECENGIYVNKLREFIDNKINNM